MNENKKSFGVKEIATTALLLALCIVSQVFKNLSVFITGPIINTCIVLTVLLVNLPCALVLSVITPVTAFFIAAAPVMQIVPAIIPLIMLGNAVLAVAAYFLFKPAVKSSEKAISVKSVIMAVVSATLKGLVMGLTISLWLLPSFIPAEHPLRNNMNKLQMTFSLVQLITALIGFVYVFILLFPLRKAIKNT